MKNHTCLSIINCRDYICAPETHFPMNKLYYVVGCFLLFIVAMTIAVIKGTLVVMFFMDVRRASSMTKLFIGAGFFWLAILLVFLLSDYLSRGWLLNIHWL